MGRTSPEKQTKVKHLCQKSQHREPTELCANMIAMIIIFIVIIFVAYYYLVVDMHASKFVLNLCKML